MNRVTVTGFGVVSPVGTGREAFFASLAAGASGIGPITRFDAGTFAVRQAAEVKDRSPLPDEDAPEAARDPKVGFLLAAAREALAEAGISSLEGGLLHLGTSLGTTELEGFAVQDRGRASLPFRVEQGRQVRLPMKIPLDVGARLLARRYGVPSLMLTNCSACAAGAQAIGHAFRGIRAGRFPRAVCGGFDSFVNPIGMGGFQLLGALSTDADRGARSCRPFDADRRGTILGEGAAVFVLESWEYARAEGKPILAEIVGFGSTLDAHSLSAPDPEGEGAARAMEAALKDAGIEPAAVRHINAHGTGTLLNDEVEAAAIRRVFRRVWEGIPVSATKSVTGHLIGAAGPVELGACLLPFMKGVLPPNLSLEAVGHGCELNHVTRPGEAWGGEYAMNNTFGFGGQNAVLVLRRALG